MSIFKFDLTANDGEARLGVLSTGRGAIDTPSFMPVGTAATVKAMTPEAVASTGAQMILGNTYHLMLRPGAERIERLGGLHKFMNWPGPILTDSGGFQVMSLSQLRKIRDEGVMFQSHIDGSRHELTPESSMDIQRMLGADITMAFDECTPYPATEQQTADSMHLSMRWARRSKESFQVRNGFGLFGIVQGGLYKEFREESSKALIDICFDGYAIGGLAVGEGQDLMFRTLDYTIPLLPIHKPRYLMGVGKPSDLVGSVARGIDMFDCVMPTRSGRTGQAFTRRGAINIRNARHKDDMRPIDAECSCPACQNYGRAYLNHLVHAKEILGSQLLTWHNLQYYQDLMNNMRQAIGKGAFQAFQIKFIADQTQGDIEEI